MKMFKSYQHKNILKHLVCFELQNRVMLIKVSSKQQLCGEEHQDTTIFFIFFLKKTKPVKQKKTPLIFVI